MLANYQIEQLIQERNRLRKALEQIAGWDCLNPPNPDLLNDLPWLKKLVDDALRGESQT